MLCSPLILFSSKNRDGMILRNMFGARRLIKPTGLRLLRSFQTIPSNSDKVIETIVHVSKIVPGNHTQTAPHPLVSYPILHIKPPNSIKFSQSLRLFSVDESLLAKLSVYGVTNDAYIDQLLKLGSQIIRLVPMLYRLLNNPLLDRQFDKLIVTSLEKYPVPEDFLRIFKDLEITSYSIHMAIALNFIQDPKRCLNSLLESIESDNFYVSDTRGLLGDILEKNYFDPIVKLNAEYVFYKGNQFTLPPLRDESVLVPNLLVNSSVSKFIPKVRDSTALLDLLSAVGNGLYKTMIRSALLKCSQGENPGIYSLLVDEAYLQFLLENIGIFDKLIESDTLREQLLSRNSRDVYYRQFGQYVSILFMNQFEDFNQWCLQLTSNYNDIYESLNPMEIRQFQKDFSTMMQKQFNWIDKQKLERMELIIKLVKTKTHEDHDQKYRNIAKDYINFCTYKEGLKDNFSVANKHQMLVLKATEKEEFLIDMGAFLTRDNKKATEYVNKLVRRLLNKSSSDIRFLHFNDFIPSIKHNKNFTFTTDRSQSKIFDLACVNYHISRDYLRSKKLNSLQRDKATDLLKHIAQIGYLFYRYSIYLWTTEHNLTAEEAEQLQSILQLKIFKTHIYENMKIFDTDNQYQKLIQGRATNKYLKLKFGQTGFDQITGVIALTNPEQLSNWIGALVESLQQQPYQIPDLLILQPSGPPQIPNLISSLKSFDSTLQRYYDNLAQ